MKKNFKVKVSTREERLLGVSELYETLFLSLKRLANFLSDDGTEIC